MGKKNIAVSIPVVLQVLLGQSILNIYDLPQDSEFKGNVKFVDQVNPETNEVCGISIFLEFESREWIDVPAGSEPILELPVLPIIPKPAEYMQLISYVLPLIMEQLNGHQKFRELTPDIQKSILTAFYQKSIQKYFQELKNAELPRQASGLPEHN